jgi:hypothetical protein
VAGVAAAALGIATLGVAAVGWAPSCLDPSNYADAYFYNAMANYKLNKIEEAEKSGLKAEHLEPTT